jgi:hypothetical protein
MVYVMLGCRCLVGLVFAVAAFSKLRSRSAYHAFAAWLAGLPVLPPRGRKVAAPVIATAEAVTVVLLALPTTVLAGFLAAAAVLAVFAAGTLLAVRRGASEPCLCFGASAAPLGIRHVVRNTMLCAAAVTGAAGFTSGPVPRPGGIVLSLAAGAIAAVFVVFLDDIAAVFGDPASTADPAARLAWPNESL